VGDRHRRERVLVEHASHCKASSGHAKTYSCWHDLTSGLTDFRANISAFVVAVPADSLAIKGARQRDDK